MATTASDLRIHHLPLVAIVCTARLLRTGPEWRLASADWQALIPESESSRLPDTLIRRLDGILAIVIGVRYLWSGLG